MTGIRIDPITRLEGHGRIEIFLDDDGDVANAYFQVPELRGFEQFCVGRAAEEMPVITSRICGVCPEAHHLAAAKALDDLFLVEAPPTATMLREVLHSAFFVTDHLTHFYVLGGPDFIIGPDGPPAERNVLGVIHKVGPEVAKRLFAARAANHDVIKILGGRSIHPTGGLPGGWTKAITEQERAAVEQVARDDIDFALATLELFDQLVLQNTAYLDMVTADTYLHRTYSMGTVDEQNRARFYDGAIRVVDPDGDELVRYHPRAYRDHLAERVESWSYLKFPYLKAVGWQGFVDGKDSGVYLAGPLARLNAADGMPTPLAQREFERYVAFFGGSVGPTGRHAVHHRLATHWARLIEVLCASERMLELATEPAITSPDVHCIPSGEINPRGGVGSVEAPRGTLTHHYEADERGVLTKVNLIVGTTNNHAAIAMSIRRAAEKLITRGRVVHDGILNRIEMAFRLYDPCLSCSTHSLPGKMPLVVQLHAPDGSVVRTFRRDG